MKHLRPFIASVLGCFLLLVAGATLQAEETAEVLTARGREALGAGNNEEALEIFDKAFSLAADRATRDRLLFYRAVTYQRLAEDAGADRREGLLHRSAELYDAYLEAHPDSGSATNNLAKVYAALGWNHVAAEHFERAVETGDDNQGLYLKNFAQFRDSTGDWEEARELYSQLIREQPLSPTLQKSVAERFAKAGVDELAGYLWQLLEAGNARQAATGALDVLASGDGSTEDRIELLTIICVALSRTPYSPTRFADLELARPLAGLGSDPGIGRGATDIAEVHDVEALNPERYRWWAEKAYEHQDPPRGVWPADGFRALIRSLGSRYQESGELRTAESYYRLAADLQPYEVDPAAVRDLTQLYIEEDQLPKVNNLTKEYENRLFQGKGGAYRNSRLRRIFEFHRTLGELYATIGRWGDSYDVDSAIFQLEHAQEKSRELGERLDNELPERYRFTPNMVNMLATGYVATNQPSKSYELRVTEAERFKQQGDTEAVRKVLEPIKTQELPSQLRLRIERLTVTPATTSAPAATTAPATTSTSAAAPTVATGRPLSSQTATTDRLRRAAVPEVRIDTSRMRTRPPLSKEQLDRVAAQLQQNLHRNVTDAPALDWGDAPGTPRKVLIDNGSGVILLDYAGETVEIPFDLVLGGTSVDPH